MGAWRPTWRGKHGSLTLPETAAALSGLTPFPALALNGAVVQWALDSVAVALGPCPDEAGACAMNVSMTSVDGVVANLRTFQVYVSVIPW